MKKKNPEAIPQADQPESPSTSSLHENTVSHFSSVLFFFFTFSFFEASSLQEFHLLPKRRQMFNAVPTSQTLLQSKAGETDPGGQPAGLST